MSAEEEERFQLSNSCWICDKFFDVRDYKVRVHNRKIRAHWSCNINLNLSRKVFVMFHNLRGYRSHFMIKEIGKFDVKVSVTSNGLEEQMAFNIIKNLVFIDSTQFMNSSLDSVVKNLWDNNLKYLPAKFSGEFLNLVKQKEVYPYEYMNSFIYPPDRSKFFSFLRYVSISEKDYLKENNIWNVFKMNTMIDYYDLYLKTDVLLLADVFEKFISI